MKEDIVNRFIKYVKIDTESSEESTSVPSTEGQLSLASELINELNEIGVEDVELSKTGVLYASIPSNSEKSIPIVGFISHFDTSPEITGKNVNPKIHENYTGGNLVLNREKNIILDTNLFSEILKYKGQTIITSDGTTLLGADDKAGITSIMSALKIIINSDFKHGEIKIAFTPDEEIGKGTDNFDIEKFGADFAYTIDGGEIGELEYENFNAATAKIEIKGKNVHPGYAKGKMINSIYISHEIDNAIPNERPENTAGYEGYFHLIGLNGSVEYTSMTYLIRDHSSDKFEERKRFLEQLVDSLNKKYNNRIVLDITDSYYNMKEKIEPVIWIVDLAKEAMLSNGIEPKVKPIRGGTDGAMLSYKGLPCPNIFTGGHNFHSRFEFVPVESMMKSAETIVSIVKILEEKDIDFR